MFVRYEMGQYNDRIEVHALDVVRLCGCKESHEIWYYPERTNDTGPQDYERLRTSECDVCWRKSMDEEQNAM